MLVSMFTETPFRFLDLMSKARKGILFLKYIPLGTIIWLAEVSAGEWEGRTEVWTRFK